MVIPFLYKIGPKYQNSQFKLKFGIWTDLNMQNLVMVFTFSVFDWINPFWAKLVQKIKVDDLSQNLTLD